MECTFKLWLKCGHVFAHFSLLQKILGSFFKRKNDRIKKKKIEVTELSGADFYVGEESTFKKIFDLLVHVGVDL